MKVDKNLALLYGIMLGDGCLWESKKDYHCNLAVVGSYYDDLPFFREKVVPLFEKFRGKSVKIRSKSYRGTVKVDFCDKVLFNKFKQLGFPIGKKGPNLDIPLIFSKFLIKYIVQGIFATDGCIVLTKNPNKYYPRIEFTSISKTLMNQVITYLHFLDIPAKLYHKIGKRKYEQDVYKIQINGSNSLLLFKEKVGFVNPKHIIKCNLFLDYSIRYDKAIKDIPNQKQKYYRIKELNGVARI